MDYPEVRYRGETGELTATHRPAATRPDLTYPDGNTVHYLATGRATGGMFGLYRWVMEGEPSGPGPHFHRTMSESFFIVAGTVRIFDGSRWMDTYPGDFVHVPIGGIHGFRNESRERAEMLLHFAPGAPREAYFEGLVGLAEMSPQERYEFFHRHDNIWLE